MFRKRFLFTAFVLDLFLILSHAFAAAAETDPALVRMEIPCLELDLPVEKVPFDDVLNTWDITEMTGAAYWLEGTSHPEYGGNTIIAAHYMEKGEPGPLFRVRELASGSEIILYSESMRYTYKVDRSQYISDTYLEYMKNRPYALTLFTCSGFNWDTGVWEQRVVVLANLIQVDSVNSGSPQ